MDLKYRYVLTPALTQSLQTIDVNRKILDIIPPNQAILPNLHRESLLKSSLFSAKIEGNQLTLADLPKTSSSPKTRAKREVFNLLKAYTWIHRPTQPKFNLSAILKLHQLCMTGLSADPGKLRTESSAIFNQAGIAIYLTPPPSEIKKLLALLIKQINQNTSHPVIRSAQAHYSFEKIHPFLDGNGRIGRLLSALLLNQQGYDFHGLLSFEEEINLQKEAYYDVLNLNRNDITPFIEYFAQIISLQTDKLIATLKNPTLPGPESQLLPRRKEILLIIRDHRLVSFNFLQRRFRQIKSPILHYELRKLIDLGYITKVGSTRGALYQPK